MAKKLWPIPIKVLGSTSLHSSKMTSSPQQAQRQKALAGLKLKVSRGKSIDDSDESFSENEETADDSVWTIVDRQNLNLQFELTALCRFCEGESVSIHEVERVGLGAV